MRTRTIFAAVALLVVASCGGDASDDQRFPDVIAATVEAEAGGTWRVAATISSPYDAPDRYADAFRVRGSDGAEYGVRVLTHPHENEQPFTRSLSGVEIPPDVDSVVIEARDSVNGWGGATVEVAVER